jgi:tetratricopeptide (TPR) repeat protein
LTKEIQDLIGNLFSFSKNKDTADIESAVALAKFGQYDKAVSELERLIKRGPLPLMAAMNLLRCDISLASHEVAVDRFKRWLSRDELSKGDLRYLSNFLRDILDKEGISHDIPTMDETEGQAVKSSEQEDEILPLSSINIEFTEGPFKGQEKEFDVAFQAGNAVSVILGADKKALKDFFKPGRQLPKIQCCSTLAVFNAKGLVSDIGKIESGPKKGSFSLDIKILAS